MSSVKFGGSYKLFEVSFLLPSPASDTFIIQTRLKASEEDLFLRNFDDKLPFGAGPYTDSLLTSGLQPEVHAERPFIVGVDERLDSPDTATLKYEAAVARANGGEVRGVSPTGVVSMAAYAKPAPIHGEL